MNLYLPRRPGLSVTSVPAATRTELEAAPVASKIVRIGFARCRRSTGVWRSDSDCDSRPSRQANVVYCLGCWLHW